MSNSTLVPNHHAHHPGFAGPSGVLAALSMLAGRREDARLAAELVGLRAGDTVVDIGCGPGTAARFAATCGATVIGIDPAPVMRRVARAVPSRRRVRWLSGSAEQTGLTDACATVVWSLATVHHWVDLERGTREVRRVLVPGGRFLAVERATRAGATGLASHGWTPEQAERFAGVLRSAGFVGVDVTTHSLRKRGDVVAVVGRAP